MVSGVGSGTSNISDRLIYILLKETGMTVQQLVNLKPGDITGKAIQCGSLTYTLSEKASSLLERNGTSSSKGTYLFSSRQGSQLTERRVQQILKIQDARPSQLRRQALLSDLKKMSVDAVKKRYGLQSLREKKYLADKEVDSFLSALSTTALRVLAELILDHGLTLNQVASLTIDDIEGNTLHLVPDRRSAHDRECIISETLREQLLSLRSSSSSLFSTARGPLSQRRIQQLLAEAGEKAGIKVSAQILRNTYLMKNPPEHATIYEGYAVGGESEA